jgi:hypothetical protein
MPDIVSIASLSKYNSCISLETGLYFVCDVIKGDLIVKSYEAGQGVNTVWSSILSKVCWDTSKVCSPAFRLSVLSGGSTVLIRCVQATKRQVWSGHLGCLSTSSDKLIIKLANPIAISDVITNLSVKTAETAFLLVKNVSGAGETCCGFSLIVEAELLTGR